MRGDHRIARNRLAIEATHFGLRPDVAERLAKRIEGMNLLRTDLELEGDEEKRC